jgi:hypothetical protein
MTVFFAAGHGRPETNLVTKKMPAFLRPPRSRYVHLPQIAGMPVVLLGVALVSLPDGAGNRRA